MDAVVVGAGLAGLSAAAHLARAGRSVLLLERASAVGGNARTRDQAGFVFNLGPHALYREGAGMSVLRELGVSVAGGVPRGGHALRAGNLHTLPVGPASLLATGLLPLRAKLDVGRLLARLPRMDAAPLAGTTVAEWLRDLSPRPEVRSLLAMILRVTTYADAPDRQSAGAALAQLQLALQSGVLYLDGGWRVLVDGLWRAARGSGAEVRTGAHVTELEERAGRVSGVRLATGESVPAGAVVLATDPAAADKLLRDPPWFREAARGRLPALAACLDVGLRRIPVPRRLAVFGFDRPLYLSVHSAVARLAPEGAAMIHVMRYLGVEPATDPRAVETELEGLLDRVQPGWRGEVVERRFIPRLVVSHDVGSAAAGGLPGRACVTVPGKAGVYLAGEWVGAEGLLADAALASGRAAARAALEGATLRVPAA